MKTLPISEYQMDARRDLPLRIKRVENRLVLDIDVRTLAFCGEAHGDVRVNAPYRWARDVLAELNREDEEGATLLSKALDAAIDAAIENGSDAVT